MDWGNFFTKDQLKRLRNITNPRLNDIINISKEFNVDIEFLIKYFIEKALAENNTK